VQRELGIYYCPSCKYLHKPPGLKGVSIQPIASSVAPSPDSNAFPFEIVTLFNNPYFDSAEIPAQSGHPSATPAAKAGTPQGAEGEAKGTPDDKDEWITFKQAKALTAWKDYAITRACDSGKVRSKGKGKGRLVHAGDLARYLTE
jgi:hypothetical protein